METYVKYDYKYILEKATEVDDIPVVKEIFSKKLISPAQTYADWVYVTCAAEHGSLNVLKYLIKEVGMSPHGYDNMALKMAVREGHEECVKYLLDDERVNPKKKYNYILEPQKPKIILKENGEFS